MEDTTESQHPNWLWEIRQWRCRFTVFWPNGSDVRLRCVCDLPRKPFRVFHPGVVARLPAPQASITAKALHVVIATWTAAEQTAQCGRHMEGQSDKVGAISSENRRGPEPRERSITRASPT